MSYNLTDGVLIKIADVTPHRYPSLAVIDGQVVIHGGLVGTTSVGTVYTFMTRDTCDISIPSTTITAAAVLLPPHSVVSVNAVELRPEGTDIKYCVSNDTGVTWLYYDDGAWSVSTSPSNSNSLNELQTALSSSPWTQYSQFKLAVYMSTNLCLPL